MACGCKKKQQTTNTVTTTPTPQTINTTVAESSSQPLTQEQQALVNKIVDKINQIDRDLI
jgi:hypothetical protein